MIPLSEARRIISSQIRPLPSAFISAESSLNRVLASAVCTQEDIPPFNRSAMDGYAVHDSVSPGPFKIVGEARTGQPPNLSISPGEAVRIFTGAPIPEGTTRVVLQENCHVENGSISEIQTDSRIWIRHQGEDAKAGAPLIPSGTRITPGEVSVLASIGCCNPEVVQIPRVIHFATGDELVAPNEIPQTGQIRDSNSHLIAALTSDSGGNLVHQQRVGDSIQVLATAISSVSEPWDLLLISGGASVGDYDFGARTLESLGFEIHFRKVNMRPGKPLIFATRDRQAAFVIPGNPLSHFVTFHLAIYEAFQSFANLSTQLSLSKICLEAPIDLKPDPRETWCPARVRANEGQLVCAPLPWQSSGDIKGLIGANALIRLSPNQEVPSTGQFADCLLLNLR